MSASIPHKAERERGARKIDERARIHRVAHNGEFASQMATLTAFDRSS